MKPGRLLPFLLALALTSCSGQFKVDLKQDRNRNLQHDLTMLKAFSNTDVPERLDIDEAVRIGIENNLDLRISRIMAEIADDEAMREKLKMLPRLKVDAAVSRRDKYRQTEYVDSKTGNTVLSNTITEELTNRTVGATLTWNLLDFGISFFSARQAVLQKEVGRMERIRQAQKLALDVSSAFHKAVLAEQTLEKISAMEAEMTGYKEKAEAMVDQKRLDPMVAKTIERDLASMAVTSKNLQAEISGARIELCNLMGVSPAKPFSLVHDSLAAGVDGIPEPGRIDVEILETVALTHRPELFAADLEARVVRDEARAAMAAMFPGVVFNLGHYYDGNRYLVNNTWSSVGVGIMDNLLSLPSRYIDLKAKGLNMDLVDMQRLMLTGGVISQTHLSLHDFAVKYELYTLQDNSHRISEQLLDMTRQRHELGAVSDTVLIQNMMESMVARLGKDRSMIQLMNAYNSLLVAIGLNYSEWAGGLPSDPAEIPPDIGEQELPAARIEDEQNRPDDKNSFNKSTTGTEGDALLNFDRQPSFGGAEYLPFWMVSKSFMKSDEDGWRMHECSAERGNFPKSPLCDDDMLKNFLTNNNIFYGEGGFYV